MSLEQVLGAFGARAPIPALVPGKFKRLRAVDDKAGATSLWVKPFADGNAIYGDWRTGEQHFYHAGGNGVARQADTAEIARRQAEEAAAVAAEQAAAASKAKKIWAASQPAPADHPYLVRKGLGAFAGYCRKGPQGLLVLAVKDVLTGEVVNLQYVHPAKPLEGRDKTFLKAGRLKSAGVWLGKPRQAEKVVICEGFATGASIHWATGLPVFCCLTSSNMADAAMNIRKKLPDAVVVLAADFDKVNAKTGLRVGLAKADQAVRLVGGRLVHPAEEGQDFNDVHVQHGLEAVRAFFE